MRIAKEPFELVIHIDKGETRATATYRTSVFDDNDSLVGEPTMQGVTLGELGENFPWTEFVGAAMKDSLLRIEAVEKAAREAEEMQQKAFGDERAADKAALAEKDEAIRSLERELAAADVRVDEARVAGTEAAL